MSNFHLEGSGYGREPEIPDKNIDLYRSINKRELTELLEMNRLTAKELIDHDGELDMTIHEGTLWDPFAWNFPDRLVQYDEGILVVVMPKNLRDINRRYFSPGSWWKASQTNKAKIKIVRFNINWARETRNQEITPF